MIHISQHERNDDGVGNDGRQRSQPFVTPLGTVHFANDTETVTVRMRVRRVGTQDLNEKEKNFPLEEVAFSYTMDGVNYEKAGSYMAVPGRWVGVKSGVFCAAHGVQEAGSCMVMQAIYASL